MERLTKENLDYWSRFSGKNQKKAGKWYQSKTDPICKYILSGTIGFQDTLNSYSLNFAYAIPAQECFHEVWILYAAVKPVTQNHRLEFQDIEICCTVSTSPAVCFINLTGFCRTTFFIKSTAAKVDGVRKHLALSFSLTRLGVQVMLMLHPKKIYLITTPMPSMQKVFINALGKNNVHIAYDEEWPDDITNTEKLILNYSEERSNLRKAIEESGENKELNTALEKVEKNLQQAKYTLQVYQSKIDSCEKQPILTIGKNRSFYCLRDQKGKILMELSEDQMMGEHRWYFWKETSYSPINDTLVIPLHVIVQNLK